MSRQGTTADGSHTASEEDWRRREQPWRAEADRRNAARGEALKRAAASGAEREASLGGAAQTTMAQFGGGLTGGDIGGVGAAGLGTGAMGDTGYHGATGIAGHVGDVGGVRHGGQERTGIAGESGFGHEAAGSHGYSEKAHATSTTGQPNTGFSSGLGNVGAQGAGAGAETAALASGGKAGLYPAEEHVDPYETGAAGGGGGDAAGDEP